MIKIQCYVLLLIKRRSRPSSVILCGDPSSYTLQALP